MCRFSNCISAQIICFSSLDHYWHICNFDCEFGKIHSLFEGKRSTKRCGTVLFEYIDHEECANLRLIFFSEYYCI